MRAQNPFAPSALLLSLLVFVVALFAGGGALADPPAVAPRLAYISGEVSFSPAGDGNWTQARINRPLTIGDRLWTDAGGRAEVQLGGAVIRMRENTSLEIMNLTDTLIQVRVDEGSVNLRVRILGARDTIEVATPNLAFTARQPGRYRIDVDGSANTTEVIVRNGRAEVYGERASYRLDSRQSYRFAGTGLRRYEYIPTPVESDYERWAIERDRRYEASISARYVSRYVVGYEELDAHGSWVVEGSYGRVWVPSRVSASWSPYSEGHWAWVEPWGWTWVDDQPWGYAVSHYGRWAHVRNRWCWIPAPVRSRPVYAPALVAFIGGAGFSLTLSTGSDRGVAWFPLGHREVYVPPYRVSRAYFDNVNRSNTNVSTTTITNIYNTRNVTNVYVNQRVRNAVVATSANEFAESRQVRRAAIRDGQQAERAQVNAGAGVAPGQQAVRGGQPAAKAEPPARVRERERDVVARSEPPRARQRFTPEERDAAAKAQVTAQTEKPAATAQTKAIVVTPQAKAPAAAPPAKAPEGTPERKADDRKSGQMADERKAGQRGDERKADEAKAKAADGKGDERKLGQRADERKADEAKAKAAEGKADTKAAERKADEAKAKAAEGKADTKAAERKADERKADERRAEGRKADERKAEDSKAPVAVPPVAAPKATPAVPPVAAPKAEPAVPPVAAPKATPAVPPVAAPKATPAVPPVAAPKAEPVPVPAPAAKQDDRKRGDEARERADQAKQQAEQARQREAQERQQKADQAKQQADQARQQKADQAKQQADQARQQRADQARKADQEREQRAAQIQQREQAKQQQADQARQQRAEQAKQQAEQARQRAEAKAPRVEKKGAEKKGADDDKK